MVVRKISIIKIAFAVITAFTLKSARIFSIGPIILTLYYFFARVHLKAFMTLPGIVFKPKAVYEAALYKYTQSLLNRRLLTQITFPIDIAPIA